MLDAHPDHHTVPSGPLINWGDHMRKILAVTAAIVFAAATLSTSASAAAQEVCTQGSLCVWQAADASGNPSYVFPFDTWPQGTYGCAGQPMWSGLNNTNSTVYLFDVPCGGTGGRSFFLKPGELKHHFPFGVRAAQVCRSC
jgi:hypothetical protein